MAVPAPVGWERAKLPALYSQAIRILAECESVDECRRWNAQAEAIASYYRQAHDETLVALAQRIKLRAWRRIGELIGEADRTIDNATEMPMGGQAKRTGTVLGEASGLNPHEIRNARKIARIDSEKFERMTESPAPPSMNAATGWHTGTKDTRGQERLESHLRGLAMLFRKIAPEKFQPVKNSDDLDVVRHNLGRLK